MQSKNSAKASRNLVGRSSTSIISVAFLSVGGERRDLRTPKRKTLSFGEQSCQSFAEAKPYLVDDISSGKLNEYDKKVTFYIELKKTIGTASGDFLDLKAYEPDMRKMIDNYITAADAEKIGDFDDLTLLDFVAKQGETLTGEGDSGHKEGAAEAIENNIRKKVIEKVTVNPRYYAKMSEILDKLIEERKQGVLDYAEML
mgnify:CR=1 FL=1